MSTPQIPKRLPPCTEYFATAQHTDGPFVRPTLHKLVLEDFYRTLSFRNAMLLQLKPGMHVLNIGSSAGVLAHFALEAGAEHVTVIETPAMAPWVRQILVNHGLQDKVTVLAGDARDSKLPQPADMLITDTLGHAAYEAGILDIAYDARARLLKPRAPIMPHAFSVFATAVRGTSFLHMQEFWSQEQFGLRMDVMLAHTRRTAHLARFRDPDLLTQPAEVFSCVIGQEPQFPLGGDCTLPVHQEGRTQGVELYFTTMLSNLVLNSRNTTSWQQVFLPFLTPLDLRAGEALKLNLRLDRPGPKGVIQGGGAAHVVGDPSRCAVIEISATQPT